MNDTVVDYRADALSTIAHRRADELRDVVVLDPTTQVAAHRDELRNVPPIQQPSATEFLHAAQDALADAKQFAASVHAGEVAERHAGDFVSALFEGRDEDARDALVSALESVTPKLPDAETQRGTIQAAVEQALIDHPDLRVNHDLQQRGNQLIERACGGRELEELPSAVIATVVATAAQLAAEQKPQPAPVKAENAPPASDASTIIAGMRKMRVGYREPETA